MLHRYDFTPNKVWKVMGRTDSGGDKRCVAASRALISSSVKM
ncbi:MAG: hypothetical protein ACYDH8_15780 [Syntrophales bacterium]